MTHIIVQNPLKLDGSFGYIAEFSEPVGGNKKEQGQAIKRTFSASKIFLLPGRHFGPNRGFGAKHIWAEHSKEMAEQGFTLEEQVPNYVATIIKTGSPVYYEGGQISSMRVTVITSRIGTAILEYKEPHGQNTYWSIVTAYSKSKPHGIRIETVRF